MVAFNYGLSAKEQHALDDQMSLDELYEKKIAPFLPPEKRRPWAVTDRYGHVIKNYTRLQDAVEDAILRNKRVLELGVYQGYRCAKSGEWQHGLVKLYGG